MSPASDGPPETPLYAAAKTVEVEEVARKAAAGNTAADSRMDCNLVDDTPGEEDNTRAAVAHNHHQHPQDQKMGVGRNRPPRRPLVLSLEDSLHADPDGPRDRRRSCKASSVMFDLYP